MDYKMSFVIPSKKIWVASYPVDFRKSIDGLCFLVMEFSEVTPKDGLFVFYNTRRNRLKILVWHHNGFFLIYKRLEQGKFPFIFSGTKKSILIYEKQLQGLLLGLDWQKISNWEETDFSDYY